MKLTRPANCPFSQREQSLAQTVRHIFDVEEGALLVSGNPLVLEHTAYGQHPANYKVLRARHTGCPYGHRHPQRAIAPLALLRR